ncbi:ComF family protein [Anaerosporobacter faecicola]|uniref:ComF family protein n=1 Tax=Anaerosporobacter faecicola TaxID=2718714 RepID=UPI00143B1F32|nr:ComF family protein [Anaerosporobacter faecicola]
MKCGKPLEVEEQEYCFDCSKNVFQYTKGYALWVYDRNVKKSIAEFKFHNRREYCEYYVEELIRFYESKILALAPQVLIPVPLHRSKLQERGFNQAALLALGLGRTLGIPVVENYLLRHQKTKAQKRLNDKERVINLTDAFAVNPKYQNVNYSNVMLVDDIYTTGSTIDACAKVLLQKSTKEVYFISLAIGKGY